MAAGPGRRLEGAARRCLASAAGALTAAAAHVEQVVRDLETAALEQRRHLAFDQPLELRTRFEVGDDAAFHAHEVVVMVLRELLRQLVAITASGTGHPHDHASLHEFSEVAVRSGHRNPRRLHHFLRGQRSVRRLEGAQHGTAMCRQPCTCGRECCVHGGGRCVGERRRGVCWSAGSGHTQTLPVGRQVKVENDSHSCYGAAMASRRPILLPALAVAALAASCASDDTATGTPVVAASFAPVEEILRKVGGDEVRVVTIVPPGEEAHEYEPTAKDLQPLEQAGFVAYIGGGFQEGVEKAIGGLPGSVRRIDLLDGLELLPVGEEIGATDGEEEGHDHGGDDPHVWLDPSRMALMAAATADALKTAGADSAIIDANLQAFTAELESLDARLRSGLSECDSRLLVTGHHAFGYLASAYDLQQVPVAGISPSDEPSAATLQQVADFARENGVRTIFFEENLPADLARTLADEIGATTAVLDPIESLSDEQRAAGASYVSLMDQNLAAMREGLGCR